MNGPEAEALWLRLREAGVVSGDAPMLDPDATAPWPIRLLGGVGAWIAVPLLLGFVLASIDWNGAHGMAPILVGAILAAASLPWLRGGRDEFQRQAGTVGNLCGLLVIAVGIASEGSSTMVALVMAGLAAVMFKLSPQWLHRFLCAGGLVTSLIWLLVAERFAAESLALVQALLVWATAAAWLLRIHVDPVRYPRSAIDPFAWALTIIALAAAWFGNWLTGYGHDIHLRTLQVLSVAEAAMLPVVAGILVVPRRQVLGMATTVGLMLATIVLAWLWRWAPGVSLSISLLLLAVPMGASVLLLVSVLSLAISLLQYYFQMADTLLAKSLALAIAGGVVLALHLILRARARRVAT